MIDILWRQDIDLGIAKEFYDYDVKKKGDEIAAEQVVLQVCSIIHSAMSAVCLIP